ncbi:MAG: hypothetical protein IJE04_05285 [Bacilli bacterium]|nr:hypothetical protein [Bacilli bacterium]
MKKIIILIFALFLVGCNKEEMITCNIEVDNDLQNYTMKGIYNIYYKDNFVTRIEKKEQYISLNEDIINYLNESKSLEYYNLNDLYGGYTYTINYNETAVAITSKIDLSLVDLKKMEQDKKIDKDYVVGNRLTTSGIVRVYESKGAICDI